MGAQQTSELKSFNNSYEYQYSGVDDDYGEVAVYASRDKPNQLISIVKRSMTTQDNIQRRMDILKLRTAFNNPYCIQIMGSHYSESTDLCGNINILYIAVEYVPKSLSNDIISRSHKNFIYTEAELWYLVKACIEGLIYYQSQSIEYQDFHPNNVRVNDEGFIKLMDLSLHQQPLSGQTKVSLGFRKFEYLAPEQQTQIKYSFEKVNVYCIGLMTTDPSEFYKDSKFIYPGERLNRYYIRNKISMKFQNFIDQLLIENPTARLSYKDILSEIQMLSVNQITIQLRPTGQSIPSKLAFYMESADVSKVSVITPTTEVIPPAAVVPPSPARSSITNILSFRPSPSNMSAQNIKAQILPALKESNHNHRPASKPNFALLEPDFDFGELDQQINRALEKSAQAIQLYGRGNETPTIFLPSTPRRSAPISPTLSSYQPLEQHQSTAIGSRIKEIMQFAEEELNKSKVLTANINLNI